MENQNITNREIYELKKEAERQKQKQLEKKKTIKKWVMWGLGGSLVIALIGGSIWYIVTRPPIPASDIVSRNGFHWHP